MLFWPGGSSTIVLVPSFGFLLALIVCLVTTYTSAYLCHHALGPSYSSYSCNSYLFINDYLVCVLFNYGAFYSFILQNLTSILSFELVKFQSLFKIASPVNEP